ncbi:MAG: hypothetical protein HQM10_09105 [Candidatus Riflebacteria bacterium]|nr:hypothetical protein [Candidatus Riflebacteria bacterium]
MKIVPFSSISIWIAFGMTYTRAHSSSAQEMESSLNFSLKPESFHKTMIGILP